MQNMNRTHRKGGSAADCEGDVEKGEGMGVRGEGPQAEAKR
jgi:hypothetical protein